MIRKHPPLSKIITKIVLTSKLIVHIHSNTMLLIVSWEPGKFASSKAHVRYKKHILFTSGTDSHKIQSPCSIFYNRTQRSQQVGLDSCLWKKYFWCSTLNATREQFFLWDTIATIIFCTVWCRLVSSRTRGLDTKNVTGH